MRRKSFAKLLGCGQFAFDLRLKKNDFVIGRISREITRIQGLKILENNDQVRNTSSLRDKPMNYCFPELTSNWEMSLHTTSNN